MKLALRNVMFWKRKSVTSPSWVNHSWYWIEAIYIYVYICSNYRFHGKAAIYIVMHRGVNCIVKLKYGGLPVTVTAKLKVVHSVAYQWRVSYCCWKVTFFVQFKAEEVGHASSWQHMIIVHYIKHMGVVVLLDQALYTL